MSYPSSFPCPSHLSPAQTIPSMRLQTLLGRGGSRLWVFAGSMAVQGLKPELLAGCRERTRFCCLMSF